MLIAKPGENAVSNNKGLDKNNIPGENANPGDIAGLNIKVLDENTTPKALSNFKGLDNNNIPRSDDETVYNNDTTLGQTKDGSSLEADLSRRLKTVEASLRLQASLGVGHLQMIEKDPEAFGLPASTRTPVRALRRRRNRALHDVTPQRVVNPNPGDNAGLNIKGPDKNNMPNANPGATAGVNIKGPDKNNIPRSDDPMVHKNDTALSQTKEGSTELASTAPMTLSPLELIERIQLITSRAEDKSVSASYAAELRQEAFELLENLPIKHSVSESKKFTEQ